MSGQPREIQIFPSDDVHLWKSELEHQRIGITVGANADKKSTKIWATEHKMLRMILRETLWTMKNSFAYRHNQMQETCLQLLGRNWSK